MHNINISIILMYINIMLILTEIGKKGFKVFKWINYTALLFIIYFIYLFIWSCIRDNTITSIWSLLIYIVASTKCYIFNGQWKKITCYKWICMRLVVIVLEVKWRLMIANL